MVFQIYKPGQGRYARITSGVLLALVAAYGCSALKDTLVDAGQLPAAVTNLVGAVKYGQVVPPALFVVLLVATIWGLNYPKFAEFLIETEVEMGRVAWPSRSSVMGSSAVVIVTVMIVSLVLYVMDWGILTLLKLAGLY